LKEKATANVSNPTRKGEPTMTDGQVTSRDARTARYRLEHVTEVRKLDPVSLVGSFFHRYDEEDGELTWQGCIVAEPAPGVYLVELFDWLVGFSSCQRLVRLEQMDHWHFFDDDHWMNNAYENSAAARDRRREDRAVEDGAA
jgi:hypothetical protein